MRNKFVLLSGEGLLMRDKLRSNIVKMQGNGSLYLEFPEFNDKSIDLIRPVGEPGDAEIAIDLLNQGWPIYFLIVGGEEYYGMTESFRSIVDINALKPALVN